MAVLLLFVVKKSPSTVYLTPSCFLAISLRPVIPAISLRPVMPAIEGEGRPVLCPANEDEILQKKLGEEDSLRQVISFTIDIHHMICILRCLINVPPPVYYFLKNFPTPSDLIRTPLY